MTLPCRTRDPDLWFPVSEADTPANRRTIEAAKAHCRTCPVITECLELALSQRAEFGIWGGHTAAERRAILRRTGLPPRKAKHAIPRNDKPLVLDLAGTP